MNARRTAVSCQRSLGAGVGGVAGGKCLMVGGGGGTARAPRAWAGCGARASSGRTGTCPRPRRGSAPPGLQIFVKRFSRSRHNVAPGRTSSRRPRAVSEAVGASVAAATPGAPCRTRGGRTPRPPSAADRPGGTSSRRPPRGGTAARRANARTGSGPRRGRDTSRRSGTSSSCRASPTGGCPGRGSAGPAVARPTSGRTGSARRPRRGTRRACSGRAASCTWPSSPRATGGARPGRGRTYIERRAGTRPAGRRRGASCTSGPGGPRTPGRLVGAGLGGGGLGDGLPAP